MSDVYTHGHHEAVLRNHRWRTAENSASYLLPSLQEGQTLLDVGCGPGTITLDFAKLVAPGRAVGVDAVDAVIAEAEATRLSAGIENVEFRTGDTYSLDFDDHSFDVVHAHQLLQHLSDPVRALREMRRVLRPGGLLAVRDGDYGAFAWAPRSELLERWMALYHQVTIANHAEADAGRFLLRWVIDAGFDDATMTSSNWTFADEESRRWWAETWAGRVEHSAFAEQAIAYGLSTKDELHEIATAWLEWAELDGAAFIVVHGEVLARRSSDS